MKRIFIALFLSMLIFSGCQTKQPEKNYEYTIITNSTFNQEQYIWEDFHFTTNRVQNIQ